MVPLQTDREMADPLPDGFLEFRNGPRSSCAHNSPQTLPTDWLRENFGGQVWLFAVQSQD